MIAKAPVRTVFLNENFMMVDLQILTIMATTAADTVKMNSRIPRNQEAAFPGGALEP